MPPKKPKSSNNPVGSQKSTILTTMFHSAVNHTPVSCVGETALLVLSMCGNKRCTGEHVSQMINTLLQGNARQIFVLVADLLHEENLKMHSNAREQALQLGEAYLKQNLPYLCASLQSKTDLDVVLNAPNADVALSQANQLFVQHALPVKLLRWEDMERDCHYAQHSAAVDQLFTNNPIIETPLSELLQVLSHKKPARKTIVPTDPSISRSYLLREDKVIPWFAITHQVRWVVYAGEIPPFFQAGVTCLMGSTLLSDEQRHVTPQYVEASFTYAPKTSVEVTSDDSSDVNNRANSNLEVVTAIMASREAGATEKARVLLWLALQEKTGNTGNGKIPVISPGMTPPQSSAPESENDLPPALSLSHATTTVRPGEILKLKAASRSSSAKSSPENPTQLSLTPPPPRHQLPPLAPSRALTPPVGTGFFSRALKLPDRAITVPHDVTQNMTLFMSVRNVGILIGVMILLIYGTYCATTFSAPRTSP